ncbi:hypothetical protein [Mesoplasma tabanidae]|uniref:Uncharacterized protein n=1 Tax=Mesoplasma tabanidae TaxID=219745 RepID=A0A2K8P730_9MOLU|nr:hypothetical protein [Mesoplasma tabanidae]ATZ21543.1 hypothetical protein MTABA_v1c03400 [Mesoplasma tabanidae]
MKINLKKYLNFEKIELNFPIFRRIFLKILTSSFFIISSFFYFLLFISVLSLSIFLLKHNDFNQNAFYITWLPFSISIVFLTIHQIVVTNIINNSEVKSSVFFIEIRAGIKKHKIFFERFIANELITFFVILLTIFIYCLFGLTSPNIYSKTLILSVAPGFLLLFFFSLFIHSILSMFLFFSPSFNGIIGMLMGTVFIVSFLISNIFVPIDINKNKDINLKYNFLYRLNEIEKKYGNEKSIIGRSTKDIYNLQIIFKDDLEFENGFYSHYQYSLNNHYNYNFKNESFKSLDKYIFELLKNGLILELNNLKVYRSFNSTSEQLNINLENIENNEFLNFLFNINSYSTQPVANYESSLFRAYDKFENKSDSFLNGTNGFFSLIDLIKKESKDNEIIEIACLVEDVAKYSYTQKYESNQVNKIDYASKEFENNEDISIWKYDNKKTEYNNELSMDFTISDGMRTFSKIFADLIISNCELKNEFLTKNDNYFSNDKYNNISKYNSYFNPFVGFTRSFFHSSLNNQVNVIDEWKSNTFIVENNRKQIQDIVNTNSGETIKIDTNGAYEFNSDSNNSFSKEELVEKINNVFESKIKNIDILIDSNKKVPVEREGDKLIVSLYVSEKNMINYTGIVEMKILFKIKDVNNIEDQKVQLLKSFTDEYIGYSKHFINLKNGKIYNFIQKSGSNFSAIIYYFEFIFVIVLSIFISFTFFNKKIIK